MPNSATPFLMFEGKAEEAMNLYQAAFEDCRVLAIDRYGSGEDGAEGTIRRGVLSVAGQEIRFFDSGIHHAFTFTPSISFFVECASETEQSRAFALLAEGGMALMPLDNYGFSKRFGWVQDRYGVTWQLNLAADA